ncbi:sensor histidine kinase [Motiliproteus coralliicola]|nr:sensor histidine kinase [Motiliproteus coralliicola]
MARLVGVSIRRQLLWMAAGLLLALALSSYWAAQAYGERAARLSYDRLLTGAALQIAENIQIRNGEVVIDLPRSAFETLALAPQDRVFYAIVETNGQFITGYPDLPIQGLAWGRGADLNNPGVTLPVFYDEQYSGEPVRFLTLTRQLPETDEVREVQVQLGQTTRARQLLAEEISWRALQLLALFFVVAMVLILGGIWLVLRPLHRLNRGLEARSPQDLSPLQVEVPREIQPLLTTINRFMQQLGGTLDGLKRFTAEAAHQIRTPLAGLKSQAQNALVEEDEVRRREQLQRVVQSSDLLSDTVSQLLSQATLAHRFQSQALEPLTLDKLITDVCRDVAVSALHQGVEVAYLGQVLVPLNGDDFALRQMLRNLLENAIKYSETGDTVEVDLQRVERGARLTVADQGPGIPDSEKSQVFERFYRSPDNPRPGSGLGLAIAREIAVHHRALLSLKDNQPRGLVVEVLFVEVGSVLQGEA